MVQLLFKKWWVVLIQGVLLILLSGFIFNNPAAVLAGISFWFGVLVLAAGLIGISNWLASDKQERENMSILWSFLTLVFGIILLTHMVVNMAALSIVFGFWVLASGILLFKNGWTIKAGNSTGWIMVIVGALSVLAAVFMIFNISLGALAISTLLAWQVLLTGIALVLLSFAKKMVQASV